MSDPPRGRKFRKILTPPEVRLWKRLKTLRAKGYHFRTQSPFRGYVLDFVCFAHRLNVEVDGDQHLETEQHRHDTLRDQVLTREGFKVLRFTARECIADADWVLGEIVQWLKLLEPIRASTLILPHPPSLRSGPSP